jgi:hypothetical protein
VELVQVDVAAAQALDRGAAWLLEDVGFIRVAVAGGHVFAWPIHAFNPVGPTNARRVALGRDVQVLAFDLALACACGQPLAHPRLGRLAVVEGNGVQLSGVKEVCAHLHRFVELRERLLLLTVE